MNQLVELEQILLDKKTITKWSFFYAVSIFIVMQIAPLISIIELSTFHNAFEREPILFNVLIIARPGMLRDSLSALLGIIPEINVVSATNDLDSALGFVSENMPLVCIMDYSNKEAENKEKLDQMKFSLPELKTIALVDDVRTKEDAESVGFDRVIVKGTSVQKLNNTVSDCIQASMSDLEKTDQ